MTVTAEPVSTGQLRYYIALSAVPTREPMRGDEPFMRPVPGFGPSWFHRHCGLDFSERWHEDPEERLRAHEAMRAEVRRRFPGCDVGGTDRDGPPDLLTGVYGTAVVPAMFGQKVRFWPDKWPAPHAPPLEDAAVDALRPLAVADNPVFAGVLAQIDRIEQLTGTARGFLNWQGVLNTAFRLRGEQVFVDLIQCPRRAHHLFDCVAATMVEAIRALYDRQGRAGVRYEFCTIANCVVNMIGPACYREHVLPFDQRIREAFRDFGVHNCAWVVDPCMDAYATIRGLGYIDMGVTSDLARARRLFPDARRTVLYTSMDLANKSEQQIREDFERIARGLAPCDVGLPDLEADLPDGRVRLAVNLCRQWTERCETCGT